MRRRRNPPGATALVIIHPDSIASYRMLIADASGRQFGQEAADRLCGAIVAEVAEHKGPVVVANQGWGESYGARVEAAVRKRRGLVMRFDEDRSDWVPFLRRLVSRLLALGCSRAIVGGVWYDEEDKSGCVNATLHGLRAGGIEALPGPEEILGSESDAVWQGHP